MGHDIQLVVEINKKECSRQMTLYASRRAHLHCITCSKSLGCCSNHFVTDEEVEVKENICQAPSLGQPLYQWCCTSVFPYDSPNILKSGGLFPPLYR